MLRAGEGRLSTSGRSTSHPARSVNDRHAACALSCDTHRPFSVRISMSSSMRSYSLLAPASAPALLLLTAAAAFSIVACRGRQSERATTDSAAHASTSAGNVVPASDTTGTVSATLDAIGPGIQVTPTDEHNVSRAIDLK